MKRYKVSFMQATEIRLKQVVVEGDSPKDALRKAVEESLPTELIYDDYYEPGYPFNITVEGEILPNGECDEYEPGLTDY